MIKSIMLAFMLAFGTLSTPAFAVGEPTITDEQGQLPQTVMKIIADANKAGVKVLVLQGDKLAAFNNVTKEAIGAPGDIPAGTTIMVIVDPADTKFTDDALPVLVFNAQGGLTGKGTFKRDLVVKALAGKVDPGI